MIVTILGEQDAEKYWELRLKALKNHPEAFGTSYEDALKRPKPIKQARENLASELSITFGAIEEESLVGMGTLFLNSGSKEKHKADIVAMYVEENYQNQGIGREILIRAIDTARRMGIIEQLHIQVICTNAAAVKLYESVGFKKYGTEQRALKVNDHYYDMDLMVMFL